MQKARRDKRAGKSATTQAGEFVHQEIRKVRRGQHGARSPQQAVAIGLSKARRAGVPLRPPRKGKAKASTRRSAEYAYEAGQGKRKTRRRPRVSRAVSQVLKREPRSTASRAALSQQARRAASRRSATARSAAASKASKTKGAKAGPLPPRRRPERGRVAGGSAGLRCLYIAQSSLDVRQLEISVRLPILGAVEPGHFRPALRSFRRRVRFPQEPSKFDRLAATPRQLHPATASSHFLERSRAALGGGGWSAVTTT